MAEAGDFRPSAGRILIFEADQEIADLAWDTVAAFVPGASFELVRTLDDCRELLGSGHFDVLVLDYDLAELGRSFFLQELEVQDHLPGVVIVSAAVDVQLLSRLCTSNRRRFVLKDGDWLSEVGPTVRYLLRVVRMEEEYEKVRAQLTEANQILKDKNRRLDEFSMTLAHDIRGPLGGISMNLEYVLDTYGSTLPDRAAELLRRALGTSARLGGLVQAMYQYAKLGAQASKMSRLDLTTLIHEVVSDLHLNERPQIKISIQELPPVWGNSELLRRVFINLITNAVKYNDKPETLIEISCEGFEEKTLGRYAKIAVADNGPGLPEEDLKTVFSMFSRSRSNSQGKEGLGVGLAVVNRIVELHYGEIALQSTLGRGSKFVISLPLEKNELVG